jgi:hypothetical protein
MKTFCLILLAACQLAAANGYPNSVSGSGILVESEVIRQRMAPYYGEVPKATVQVKDIGQSVQEYSAKAILDEKNKLILMSIPQYVDIKQSEKDLANVPQTAIDTNNTQKIAESAKLNLNVSLMQRTLPGSYSLDSKGILSKIQTKNIPQIDKVYTPDVFTIRLEFDWNAPHGQWMTQLLKDIKSAKAAGDVETYTRLSAQYSAWADKYLLKGTPPRVMK